MSASSESPLVAINSVIPTSVESADLPRSLQLHQGVQSSVVAYDGPVSTATPTRWVCPHEGCGRSYSRRDHFRVHMSMHATTGGVGFTCPVPGCGKTLSSPDHVKTHLRLVHETEGKHACPECGARFKMKTQLRQHTLEIHGFHEFMCPHEWCRKIFTSTWYLNQHLSTHESQARTKRKREGDDDDDSDMTSRDASTITESSAPVRQRSTRSAIIKDVNNTASSSTVGDLVAAEESIAAFDCPVQGCGKTYTLRKNLLAHMRARHSELSALPSAAINVNSDTSVTDINRSAGTGDPPLLCLTLPFPCPALGCSQGFGYKSVLKRHLMKIHGLDMAALSAAPSH